MKATLDGITRWKARLLRVPRCVCIFICTQCGAHEERASHLVVLPHLCILARCLWKNPVKFVEIHIVYEVWAEGGVCDSMGYTIDANVSGIPPCNSWKMKASYNQSCEPQFRRKKNKKCGSLMLCSLPHCGRRVRWPTCGSVPGLIGSVAGGRVDGLWLDLCTYS